MQECPLYQLLSACPFAQKVTSIPLSVLYTSNLVVFSWSMLMNECHLCKELSAVKIHKEPFFVSSDKGKPFNMQMKEPSNSCMRMYVLHADEWVLSTCHVCGWGCVLYVYNWVSFLPMIACLSMLMSEYLLNRSASVIYMIFTQCEKSWPRLRSFLARVNWIYLGWNQF